ncbi:MAG: hypothetical protein NWF00_02580 [Candidatus Bathyarchaeota archaeon]|nr:hypothetical protein [Candidatus Bathyarchaeota archaeon]
MLSGFVSCSDSVATDGFIYPTNQISVKVTQTPLFRAKKEVYTWLKEGTKTIDVRKGNPRQGDIAIFQSGAHYLQFPIIKKETGKLYQVIRADNYRQVIPSAENLEDALNYLRNIYNDCGGSFTAYYLTPPQNS